MPQSLPSPGRCKSGAKKEKPGEIGVSDHTALGTFLAAPGTTARKRQEEFSFSASRCYFSSYSGPQSYAGRGFETSPKPSFLKTALGAELEEREVEEKTAKQREMETWWLKPDQVYVSCGLGVNGAGPLGEILISPLQSLLVFPP